MYKIVDFLKYPNSVLKINKIHCTAKSGAEFEFRLTIYIRILFNFSIFWHYNIMRFANLIIKAENKKFDISI